MESDGVTVSTERKHESVSDTLKTVLEHGGEGNERREQALDCCSYQVQGKAEETARGRAADRNWRKGIQGGRLH